MKFLTRQEEQVLLAVFRLKDNACLISIQAQLNHFTGKEWSISSVYIPLSRLEKRDYLKTRIGQATEKRGGKAVKYYLLTKIGFKALAELEAVNEVMWRGMRGFFAKLENS